ncbi:MAG: pyrroline-5-carboxylate reductase [Thermoprotei archaeon]|nr:MAG: pyrroline-5-carboxylate reductase [Thermoprotei archaeon]
MRLAVVGYGKMGEALAKAFWESSAVSEILAYDILKERLKAAEKAGFRATRSLKGAVEKAEVVLLSVKPNNVPEVSDEWKGGGKLLLSIVAGYTTSLLGKYFPEARIIRAMPNINVVSKAAFVALCRGPRATDEDLNTAVKLFSSAGEVEVVDEKLMDAITAVSGSGPAIAAYLIDAVASAGVYLGIPRPLAEKIARVLFLGTAKTLSKMRTENLIWSVATPGGTTVEALMVLEKEGVKGKIMESLKAAAEKSRRLATSK